MTQLVRFAYRGRTRVGVVDEADYLDLTLGYADLLTSRGRSNALELAQAVLPPDTLAYFDAGDEAYRVLRDAVDHIRSLDVSEAAARGARIRAADAELLVPIPNPRKILCLARNFRKHAAEAGLEVSEIPILFSRFAATQIAHGKPIVVPTVSDQVDWEGELAVVIGRGGRHIAREDAMTHVAGYTLFNDVTVRDYQFRVSQYTEGKNFAASGPVGPHISLADEGIDPHVVDIVTRVNGEEKQRGNTSDYIFDIPAIINEISTFIDVEPGDIISMGTPSGVGFKRTPPEFLHPGDTVEVEVPEIGILRNPVIAEDGPNV